MSDFFRLGKSGDDSMFQCDVCVWDVCLYLHVMVSTV